MTKVNPAADIYNKEFSPLMGNPGQVDLSLLTDRATAISGAGIYLYCPPVAVNNYLNLVTREMVLKREYLHRRQPVHYLRISGLPLRQFRTEELTELLFWLCTYFNVLDGSNAERRINLAPDQCSSANLALLKGLGFNNIRLCVDASIAGPDRSLDPVFRAINDIHNYRNSLSGEIIISADTSAVYMDALLELLIESKAAELEFNWEGDKPELADSQQASHGLYRHIAGRMDQEAYQLIGNKCFKHRDHQDLLLLCNNRLRYGPWGFYSCATSQWLGLGIGSAGIAADYLYRNAPTASDYQRLIMAGKPPVTGWSNGPISKEQAFRFIQSLYCFHRVEKDFFASHQLLLDTFNARGWIREDGGYMTLTAEGTLNLANISNLYSRLVHHDRTN